METNKPTIEERRQIAADLIRAAELGMDVRDADPRQSSSEAVIWANRIRRTGGKVIELL